MYPLHVDVVRIFGAAPLRAVLLVVPRLFVKQLARADALILSVVFISICRGGRAMFQWCRTIEERQVVSLPLSSKICLALLAGLGFARDVSQVEEGR